MKKLLFISAAAFLSTQLLSCTGSGNALSGGKCDTAAIIEWYKTTGGTKTEAKKAETVDQLAKAYASQKTVNLKMLAGTFVLDVQGDKIHVDSANVGIGSYVDMHPYDNEIKSFYFNKQVVSDYLKAGAEYIKVSFAHTHQYARNHSGPEQFSLIVVGVDGSGKYILLSNPQDDGDINWVYNNVAPCPSICGIQGTPMMTHTIGK